MRHRNARSGLSMVELLVGLSIALTIAVVGIQLFPTVTNSSREAEAHRALDQAVLAQTSFAASNESYAIDPSDFESLPSGRGLRFTDGSSGSNDLISVTPTGDGGVALAVLVSEGSCLGLVMGDPYNGGEPGDIVEFAGVCSAESVISQ